MNRVLLLASALLLFSTAAFAAANPLLLYSIDVEGGQATLFVSPSGQSLLVDTGWPGFNDRDVNRIVAAAKAAGISQIDYVLITHYHRDHVGGAPQLAAKIKIGAFIDHGPNLEDSDATREDFAAYEKILPGHNHLVVKPGDRLPIKGMDVEVLSGAGNVISKPLSGAGQPNPVCTSEPKPEADQTENARSLGILISYGKFRLLDLGDLTKDKELELVCPNNLIGKIDLFIVSHHGWSQSNTKAFVSAISPKAAIMNNGAHKGATPETWQIVEDVVGPDRLWQLHYAVDGGPQHNVPEKYIANPDEKNDAGDYIKAVAYSNGTFEITNARNDAHMTYGNKAGK
jgi:competence protein ComEC